GVKLYTKKVFELLPLIFEKISQNSKKIFEDDLLNIESLLLVLTILLKNLDILFPFNDSAFTRRAKEYLSLVDNLDRLHAHLMEKGTPTQLLNFGRLLKDIKRDDLADSAFGKAYSNGAGQAEEERFLDFLDIAFVANNGAFVEKTKAYLGEDDNLDRLYGRVMGEGTATQLFNFAMVLKNMGRMDIAPPCFASAASRGSLRAQLELAYYDIESGAEVAGRLSALGTYGFWKIAQCFRYGRKVERDLRQANYFYLQSLAGIREFPEIAYDAGDFVEELAVAQKDQEHFKATSRKAIEYFRASGNLHGSGYIRAAQLMVKARERCADLSIEFNDGEIFGLASLAAQKGAYTKATTFLKRIGQDPSSLLTPSTIGVDKLIKDINKKFGE
ncbi:MAG: hypothetical protein K2Q34_08135, partial [Alphaproteobacteria bacterium]|nr:hypothetical protein [Alphaproteobacteria bacterium]